MNSVQSQNEYVEEVSPAEKIKTLRFLAKVDVKSLPENDIVLYGLDGAEIRAEPSSLVPGRDRLFQVFLRYGNYRVGWILDGEISNCLVCNVKFNLFIRRHHCRKCGIIVCDKCSSHRAIILQLKSSKLSAFETNEKRVCNLCAAQHRLNEVWDLSEGDEAKVIANTTSVCMVGSADTLPLLEADPPYTDSSAAATPQYEEDNGEGVAPTPLNLMDAIESESGPHLDGTASPSLEQTPQSDSLERTREADWGASPLSDVTASPAPPTEVSPGSDVTRTPGSAARRRSSWQVMAEMADLSFDSGAQGSKVSAEAVSAETTSDSPFPALASTSSSEGGSDGEEGQHAGGGDAGRRPSRRGSWLQVLGLDPAAAAPSGNEESEVDGPERSSSSSGEGRSESSASGSSIGDSDIKKYLRRTRRERSGSRDYEDSASSVSSSSRSLSIDQFVSPFGGQRITSSSKAPSQTLRYRESAHISPLPEVEGRPTYIEEGALPVLPAESTSSAPSSQEASATDSDPPAAFLRKGSLKWFFGLGGDSTSHPSRRSSDPGTFTGPSTRETSVVPQKRATIDATRNMTVAENGDLPKEALDGSVVVARVPSLGAVFSSDFDSNHVNSDDHAH